MFEQTLFVPGQKHKKISFEPNLFWIKNLEQGSHFLVDNEHSDKSLSFDLTDGYHTLHKGVIQNNKPTEHFDSYIAAFNWKTKFMSKISYSGDGKYGRQIQHNLSSKPEFILFKKTNTPGDWIAWHNSFLFKGYMKLNTDDAFIEDRKIFSDKVHNQYQLYLGQEINQLGEDYMCYCFGFSEYFCSGFYKGKPDNFVKTKNKPDLVIIKSVDCQGGWRLFSRVFDEGDSLRMNSFGGLTKGDDILRVQLRDDGFYIEHESPALNYIDNKYIYMAFTNQ